MRIEFLGEHVELIPQIAAWQFEEWGHLTPGDTLEKRVEAVRRRANVDEIPLTLIALSGAVPVGTVALVEHDLPGRDDLTPWLSNLLVPRQLRRQGIGSALIERAVRLAAELGRRRLHLFAWDHLDFYRQRGWKTLETAAVAEREVTLMRIDTSRRSQDEDGA